MIRALIYGVLSSFFFSLTFILNREMAVSNGSWQWSASLRYLFMLILLLILLIPKKSYALPIKNILANPLPWLIWSSIGFGCFYIPLCYVANSAPAWLIAGSWQLTIPIGALLTPLFSQKISINGKDVIIKPKIPRKVFFISCFIAIGVGLLLFPEMKEVDVWQAIKIVGLVLIAAIAYPLGNRKIMLECSKDLSTMQRVFAMTVASLPIWIFLSIYQLFYGNYPSYGQLSQSALVAVFSGVVATWLFFEATYLVRFNLSQLAVVEATQSGEVIFALISGVLFFHDKLPELISYCGLALIIGGMFANSLLVKNSSG